MQRMNVSEVVDFELSTGLNSLNVLVADATGQTVALEFSYETLATMAGLFLVTGRCLTPPIDLPAFPASDVRVFPRENGEAVLQFMDDRGTLLPVLVSQTSSMQLNIMAHCVGHLERERIETADQPQCPEMEAMGVPQ
ncbi:hypothetical protein P7F60_27785 [Rhizobium sp. YJ-22]|uniref:hypothetical protein n=1 Tax=Rhizobium sp. YJ-22 TaxID=3037556 RepID=UPI002412D16F|nr:hypothetical protein [Rhizobium sp. YJ-22]MDG3580194.1 hypothetical protein [Rhizobium sp. YJ-22]